MPEEIAGDDTSTSLLGGDPSVVPGDSEWHGAEELRKHLIPIERLRPFPGNARRGDVPRIAESLRRFGQVRPVLATLEEDGLLTIVAGHHVTLAAKALGWEQIAVVTAEFATHEDAMAYLVADNQLAQLGGFDPKQVSLLDELMERGSLEGTGFTEEDIEAQKLIREHRPELTDVKLLRYHEADPRTYPDEFIKQMVARLKRHGMTRPVVVARDGTILAGGSVYEAAKELGVTRVPVIRLDLMPDDPDALNIMTADQEMDHMVEVDDRKLVANLTKLAEEGKMDGTGWNLAKLRNLVHVTRPPAKSKRVDEQREWEEKGGGIGFTPFQKIVLAITCDSEEHREQLASQLGLHCRKGIVWSARWPTRPYEDPSSLFWRGEENEQPDPDERADP